MSNLDKIDQKLLKELHETVKDWICGMELGGSACCDFINNPGDFDIELVAKDYRSYKKLQGWWVYNFGDAEHNRKFFKQTYGFCLQLVQSPEALNEVSKTIFGYQSHYRKPLLGYSLINCEYNFLEHEDYYKKMVATSFNMLQFPTKVKPFYYVYTGKSIYNNKSYTLTAQQITNINLLHDYDRNKNVASRETILALIQECLDWLGISVNLSKIV